MAKRKKFKRNSQKKLIAGVLAGVADYYDQDPTIVRIAWLLLMGFTGFIPGLLAYVLTIFLVPTVSTKNTASNRHLAKVN